MTIRSSFSRFHNRRFATLLATPLLLAFAACGAEDEPAGSETSLGETVDADGDGVADLIDINGDGVIDGVAIDVDGDGIPDAAGIDTTGDGFVDSLDYDGDGVADPVQQPGGDGDVAGDGDVVGDGDGVVGDGDGIPVGDGDGTAPSPEEECLGGYLIEDFEDPSTYSLLRPYNDGSFGGVTNHNGAFTADSSTDGGSMALYMSGTGFSNWGAGIGRKFDVPVDCKGRSTGIRFRAKGPAVITVAAPVSAIVPVNEGGSCTAAEACNNGHERTVRLDQPGWGTYEVYWDDLAQLPGWGLPSSFDPRSVLEILFAARPEAMPYDYWIDDVELIDDGSAVDPGDGGGDLGGTGGSDGGGVGGGGCVLDDIMGEAMFNSWFQARRNPFYTYQNLCTALEDFPLFANSGNDATDRQEVAAFFANVARETGELEYIEEITPTVQNYYGRGPIQLTHNYNYQAAGEFLGLDLIGDPGMVSRDGVVAWQTALWFWVHSDGAAKGTCNGAIVQGRGFGQTINIINGGLECPSAGNSAAQQRVNYYTRFCDALGLNGNYGPNLNC